jgi:hypothetical protein
MGELGQTFEAQWIDRRGFLKTLIDTISMHVSVAQAIIKHFNVNSKHQTLSSFIVAAYDGRVKDEVKQPLKTNSG